LAYVELKRLSSAVNASIDKTIMYTQNSYTKVESIKFCVEPTSPDRRIIYILLLLHSMGPQYMMSTYR
jgi:hypothetical protein